ncbi:MAG: DUF5666 domain-containing protein [Candidatus Acidiferrales bacterium]
MRKALLGLTLCAMLILAITLAGCGGSYSGSTGPIGSNSSSAPVSLTIGDDPPAGVAILRYQTQVTDAELQPMDPTQPPVSMLLGPLNVELLHLQTETAPLGNINVPSGIYSGLTATFANPEMTVFNNSAQTLTLGSQTCAPNQICIFNPTLNQTTASVTSPTAPFPVTLSANSPLGFEMHFDVNASVQGNLTVSPQITLKQVIPPSPTSPIDQFHVIGRISAINSPTFTIQTGFGNLSAVITTNSSTTYDFGSTCVADNFSCLTDGQVVGIALNLIPGGTLIATHVRLFENPGLPSLQGIIIRVNAAQNQFDMVLLDLQETFASVLPGLVVTVQTNGSTTFGVDSDGVTLPAGVSFTGVASLMPGQTVEVHPTATPVVTAGPTALPLINVPADSVSLEASEISGVVGSVNAGGTPPNFMLVALSPLFAHASISLIQVDSVTGTIYINATGLSGLTAGDNVSVGGLLFNTPVTPTIVAERVRLR